MNCDRVKDTQIERFGRAVPRPRRREEMIAVMRVVRESVEMLLNCLYLDRTLVIEHQNVKSRSPPRTARDSLFERALQSIEIGIVRDATRGSKPSCGGSFVAA